MHRQRVCSSFITMAVGGVLAALFSGCAHELAFTSDTQGPSTNLSAFGDHADQNTPRSPAAVCDQYLALLSEEPLQAARPRYGLEGECWTGDASQRRACESECRSLTYNLIKSSLSQMEAEKQQAAAAAASSSD